METRIIFFFFIIFFCIFIGFLQTVPLHLVCFILFLYKPALKQLSFFDVGYLWDLPWIVGYILSILFSETEATAMMFIDSQISSSSIEVMPNGIGSELEGRPEILRMDQKNPQQPALPLNPHAEQQTEISHPASAAGQ